MRVANVPPKGYIARMPQSPLEQFVGSMTVSEFAKHTGKSVEQIAAWASGARAPASPKAAAPAAAAPAGKPAPGKPGPKSSGLKAKAVNTRTPEGRAAYDEAVLEAVTNAKEAVGSSYLRRRIGGTPLQLRTALNRLIEGGKVSYQGKARATRYLLR